MAFDTIVFDLGGVLIDWNPRYLYRQIFDDESAMEHFLSEVCTPAWNALQDAGRSFQEATEERVALFPAWEREIRAFYGRWEETLGGPIQGTVDILESLWLGRQYRLYALTNWSAESFPVAQQRYDFLGWFEGIVVSGVEQCAKPDPALYHILLDRYAIDPGGSIYIDDSLPNVQTARNLGMEVIHFQSPMQLREALAERL
ncbi:MAG: HAD-IA family hydrolase [Bacteroidia bacterium]